MGEVYLAEDESLARKVALKLLSEGHRNNAELKARFLREARAVAKISHPNVVQVFSIEEFQGRPCFAMEFLTGDDLGVMVKDKGPMPQAMAIACTRDAAHGLAAAAAAGLIHRDVKPTNLMLTDKGIVKVTDFGLAKPLDSADPGLTQAGVVVGTPDYIAPEQARGDELDERVDIYALGCTLFYLISGRPPFRQQDDAEDRYLKVVARHIRSPVPDLRQANGVDASSLDDDVAELCKRMMAKRPADRPSYEELTAELDGLADRLAGISESPSARRRRDDSQQTRQERTPPPRAAATDDLGGASLDGMVPGGRRALPWAKLATAATALFFAVSLALLLTAPQRRSSAAVAAVDAGPLGKRDAAVPVAPAPTPPPGFLLTRDLDGKPAFFVSRLPVSRRDYEKLVGARPVGKGARPEANAPMTDVSFAEARGYASKAGRRLMTPAEWDLAIITDGFSPAGMLLWEWVDDGGTASDPKQRPLRKAPVGTDQRPPTRYKDVAFRLAADLP
ncbi:MAG: protein kinase [Deltaproteobacteria bacterium]|nr:protein kinase [Deltaproteobacteria bacterium]